MHTHIYRLVPVALPDDPYWDLTADQGEVVVRALSSGDARVVAEHAEAAALSGRPQPVSTQVSASAFRSEKLYHVVKDASGAYPSDGPRALLQARFHVPEGYVVAPTD